MYWGLLDSVTKKLNGKQAIFLHVNTRSFVAKVVRYMVELNFSPSAISTRFGSSKKNYELEHLKINSKQEKLYNKVVANEIICYLQTNALLSNAQHDLGQINLPKPLALTFLISSLSYRRKPMCYCNLFWPLKGFWYHRIPIFDNQNVKPTFPQIFNEVAPLL